MNFVSFRAVDILHVAYSQRRTFYSFSRAVSCCYCQHFRCRNFITLIVGFMRSHTTHLTLACNFIQCKNRYNLAKCQKKTDYSSICLSVSFSFSSFFCLFAEHRQMLTLQHRFIKLLLRLIKPIVRSYRMCVSSLHRLYRLRLYLMWRHY